MVLEISLLFFGHPCISLMCVKTKIRKIEVLKLRTLYAILIEDVSVLLHVTCTLDAHML
jgi:hypothetical protein